MHRTDKRGTNVLVFGLAAEAPFTYFPVSFKRLKQNKQAIHIGPLDKEHDKIISDTYALQQQE
jgi:hypothetical protein